jgi:fibronectin type 3 domain-containing protein
VRLCGEHGCCYTSTGARAGTGTSSNTAPTPAPAPTATLKWDSAANSGAASYRVYFGNASRSYLQARGSGVEVGANTQYVAAGLQQGLTYYFSVTSVDGNGIESAYSNEAQKTIQ